ncbi:EVE domain-containing protein [Parvularcula sp. LCG005]|uniref:EVE domain-containing protein n=1 Tax=Parvularcula sp. LCG005 TaxID=3078805 RepID=UPI0029428A03|nr:EVE domain-containing protein [Parvularcula sp. LCG005]WOI53430.1 EVE domain-containing protein [Parvularcula sp. LCG005]
MAYWLFKSEPATWSWDQQVAKGVAGEIWNGVRNHQAKNFMQAMKKGDRGFFYHSQTERAVVGIVEVTKEAEPDPTAEPDSPWECVTVKAIQPVASPVTLKMIKDVPELAEMVLVKNSRLSVQPVEPDEWKLVCKMAGVKP